MNTKKMINFTGMRKPAMILSGLLMLASIFSLFTNGLNLGVDFTGGTVIEIGYDKPTDVEVIRNQLLNAKFDAAVQHFGTAKDVLIRIAPQDGLDKSKIGDKVFALLKESNPEIQLRRVEFVGPQIGDELRDDGGTANPNRV